MKAFSNAPFSDKDQQFETSDALLAEAILKLLGDEALKRNYCAQAKKRIADFSSASIQKQWVDLIEHLSDDTIG